MTERHGHDHVSTTTYDENHANDLIFYPFLLQSIFKQHSIDDNKLHGNIYDEKYLIRPLSVSDDNHGYIELLSQLTECGKITHEEFKRRFYQMKQCLNTYYILVIEDLNRNKQVIGTATLVCEKKFIRQLATRGRIEDVVVDNRYRGQQLGKLLIELLTKLARDKCDCYKISLECKDELVKFYQQFGYAHEEKQNYLCQRFAKPSIKKA